MVIEVVAKMNNTVNRHLECFMVQWGDHWSGGFMITWNRGTRQSIHACLLDYSIRTTSS